MNINDYDFEFPEELIGQKARPKGSTRIMVCNRKDGSHRIITSKDVVDYFNPGDCLVVNNTKVIPARIRTQTQHGGEIEILLVQPRPELGVSVWEAWVRPGKKFKVEKSPLVCQGFTVKILEVQEDGTRVLDFGLTSEAMQDLISRAGKMPLPPYIKREASKEDEEGYQTVFARFDGAVASPTASLHFSDEMVEALKIKGVHLAEVTLHVGPGTFKPVEVEDATKHPIHGERFFIDEEQAAIINKSKAAGGRIIGLGTTATRVLETMSDDNGVIRGGEGTTHIYIYPGYRFKILDGLITNFHWPKSTLLLLVSAFWEKEQVFKAYEDCIANQMQLFSYGDGMFIGDFNY